ncbi:MAG: tRNA (adenosine(37)-N6)-dimethylallyltransferase MiaA [Oscillospiraceae bacterium]|jgi:tRNA dimethylallyltransferase|nr:tRNA (adenosine(37)-N6)-dimethylallyltransferase MiaA [Oscillospiraceae bacterium]
MQSDGKIKAVAVVGPTASGKSDIGVELARRLGGEIISADSRQVYRGFDLCSGKATRRERDEIAHHLLDVRDVGEQFTVADFQAETYRLIPEIAARGNLPIIVGGTGLYIDSVLYGYELSGCPPDRELRERLSLKSGGELRAELASLNIELRAEGPTYDLNRRRMIRLIERARSGKPISYNYSPEYDILPLGVTHPREILDGRIERRLRERLDAGMADEVADYLEAGGDSEIMLALGLEFRHICMYLTGRAASSAAPAGGADDAPAPPAATVYASAEDMARRLYIEIRRFSKRQTTWFKRNKGIVWLDMSGDYTGQACEEIGRFLTTTTSSYCPPAPYPCSPRG